MENTEIINGICSDINRRIKQMTYTEETAVRQFIESEIFDGKFSPLHCDAETIANILEVNDNCIADLLGLNEESITLRRIIK